MSEGITPSYATPRAPRVEEENTVLGDFVFGVHKSNGENNIAGSADETTRTKSADGVPTGAPMAVLPPSSCDAERDVSGLKMQCSPAFGALTGIAFGKSSTQVWCWTGICGILSVWFKLKTLAQRSVNMPSLKSIKGQMRPVVSPYFHLSDDILAKVWKRGQVSRYQCPSILDWQAHAKLKNIPSPTSPGQGRLYRKGNICTLNPPSAGNPRVFGQLKLLQ